MDQESLAVADAVALNATGVPSDFNSTSPLPLHAERACFGMAVYDVVTATRAHGASVRETSSAVATLCIVSGVVMAGAGRWVLTPSLLVAGFAVGVGAAYAFMQDERSPEMDVCSRGLMFAAVCGVVGAALLVAVWRCAYRLVIFIAIVAFLHQTIATLLVVHPGDGAVLFGLPAYPHWIAVLGGALLVTCVLSVFPKQRDILTTCLLGAWTAVAGLKSLTSKDPYADWVYALATALLFATGFAFQCFLPRVWAPRRVGAEQSGKAPRG
tara:strand:- start:122 stop:928 length:807 start_codon:yes stop_codon:yes gene_type:complete